jgi:hypothetical protein
MMKNELEGMYKFFVVVLLGGIIFSLASYGYMRNKVQTTGGYTELYFNDHLNLPEKMKVNKEYNVSFTFTNNEIEPKTYVYNVDSTVRNISHEIKLGVGESATIMIVVQPGDRDWNITGYVDSARIDVLKNFGNSTLETREVEVGSFGKILYENVSFKELESRPLRSFKVSNSTIQNVTEYAEGNYTLRVSDKQVLLDTLETRIYAMSVSKPFIIKLYKKGDREGDELEVHFWQEIS